MKPMDHYRLSMYLHTQKILQQRLDDVNAKIERVQHQPRRQLTFARRFFNWWFA